MGVETEKSIQKVSRIIDQHTGPVVQGAPRRQVPEVCSTRRKPMDMLVFTGLVWKENTEFSALCPELDVASQGRTQKEARQKLLEAATLYLEGSFVGGLAYIRLIPATEDPRNSLPAKEVKVFKFKVDVAIRAYA